MFSFLKKKHPEGSVLRLSILGMHCTSCSLNIDGELEEQAGVLSSRTSYARSEATITYDPKKINESQLLVVVQKLGYEVRLQK